MSVLYKVLIIGLVSPIILISTLFCGATIYGIYVTIRGRGLKQNEENALFDEDLKKINNACTNYPIGSNQIGEIARLSGFLYGEGIDVVHILKKLCKIKRLL